MIEVKKRCITSADEIVILHGCNCQGRFNAGIAKAIRNKWPAAYSDYMRAVGTFPKPLLGQIVTTEVMDGQLIDHIILSAFTQDQFGWDGKRYVSYDALADVLEQVANFLKGSGLTSLASSRLGCSLGGASWTIVEAMFNHYLPDVKVTIYDTA